ncbi:ARM REPEAT PROTEIN INTERACTING WITH ABF2-like [Apium graveolens]|uniref:ARM REPEAT PROTEIN INTERACTING WITH ABF2-like n=1 Tax=Apium graveolens TaxID=4045 RepID=UPI003D7B4E3E
MVQRGAIDPLIKLVKSQDVELQEFSAFALGLLAQDTHSRAGIAQSGGVVPLLNLLDSNIEQVQQNAAYALSELAKDEDNAVDIIVAGGVQKLKDGEYLVEETRNYVSDTLDTLEEKMNEQVLRHLLYLMRIADRSIQERIALTLSHLCLPDDQKSIFVNNNGLDILLDLLASTDLNSNDLHQRLYTSYARWTQVRHPQSHRISHWKMSPVRMTYQWP